MCGKTKAKIITAIILLIAGIGLFFSSDYITKQVAIGRGQIYNGQQKVNAINNLVDNTTQVKGLGGVFTGSAQQKINAGKKEANYYEKLAARIQIGGILLIIISAILFLFAKKDKKWCFWRR